MYNFIQNGDFIDDRSPFTNATGWAFESTGGYFGRSVVITGNDTKSTTGIDVTFQINFGGQSSQVVAKNDITTIEVTGSDTDGLMGSLSSIASADIDIRIHYMAITYGSSTPAMAPQPPLGAYVFKPSPKVQSTQTELTDVVNGQTVATVSAVGTGARRLYTVKAYSYDESAPEGVSYYKGIISILGDLNGSPASNADTITSTFFGNMTSGFSLAVAHAGSGIFNMTVVYSEGTIGTLNLIFESRELDLSFLRKSV